jgi:hypothetical protein
MLDRAAQVDLDVLEIGPKSSPADPGHLAAYATQVLRLALASVLIAADGLFAADCTLHSHNLIHRSPVAENGQYTSDSVDGKLRETTLDQRSLTGYYEPLNDHPEARLPS